MKYKGRTWDNNIFGLTFPFLTEKLPLELLVVGIYMRDT